MSTRKVISRVSLEEKRCFLCGLDKMKVRTVVERQKNVNLEEVVDFEAVSDLTNLEPETVRSILTDPQAVDNFRLDPNRVTRAQLKQITALTPERVEIILNGRPYYSIEELEAATKLSRTILDELFTISSFRFYDKSTEKEIEFVPVPGRYIIPPQQEFEDPADAAGYMQILPTTKNFDFRVVESIDFLAEQAPHELKAGFDGNVHPVLRDSEGFERFPVPGSLDLWFTKDVAKDEGRCRSIIAELGLQVTNSVPEVGYYRAKLTTVPDDRNLTRAVLAVIDQTKDRPEIQFAEMDQVGFEDFGPADETPAGEDDFEAADRFWNHEAINLAGAHAIEKGSPNVTIFIIDSGCWMNHEDLVAAFRNDWGGLDLNFDLGEPENTTSPIEVTISHGTKVAGVVGGQGQDELTQQVRGIAPGCRILPVKISGQSATPAYGLRAAAIQKALTYSNPGTKAVLNLSWRTNGEHIGIREALAEAQRQGVAIVASAGNYSSGASQRPDEPHYPSGHVHLYPQLTALCSVGAVEYGDRKASYSYYGGQSVTVAAPGGAKGGAGAGIYTTSTPEKRVYTQGTSFAAPHVAGLIGLLFSAKSDLTPAEAIQIIKETAEPTQDNLVHPLGTGRINARAALERIAPPSETHLITATAGIHGTIAPIGEIMVPHGTDQIFTITPDPGYRVAQVLIDGHSMEGATYYKFSEVVASHTIEARFVLKEDQTGRLNINLASAEELITLPLIGSWLAERIIRYREAHGPFSSIYELTFVGVSPWAIGQLKPLITV